MLEIRYEKGKKDRSQLVPTRHWHLPVAGTILLALIVLANAGCGAGGDTAVLGRGHVVLARGRAGGTPWRLIASEEHQGLGLFLVGPSGRTYSGAVGFSASPTAGFWMEGDGPGTPMFYYGPAPLAATQVQLSAPGYAPILAPTRPIPLKDGLPRGRFFVVEPPGPPTVRWNVTLLDVAGHKVAFADF